jgi:chromosome segregation ATPase
LTRQHLRAAEEENETLQNLIQKHRETIWRVQDRERELDSEADGTKKALERVSREVEVLRGSMERLMKEKTNAEHLAG